MPRSTRASTTFRASAMRCRAASDRSSRAPLAMAAISRQVRGASRVILRMDGVRSVIASGVEAGNELAEAVRFEFAKYLVGRAVALDQPLMQEHHPVGDVAGKAHLMG